MDSPYSNGPPQKTRASTHLEAAIQCARNGDTLGGLGAARGDGRDQRVQLVPLLLELLDEGLDGPLGEGLALPALPVAHEAVHDGQAGVGAGRRHGGHPGLLLLAGGHNRPLVLYWSCPIVDTNAFLRTLVPSCGHFSVVPFRGHFSVVPFSGHLSVVPFSGHCTRTALHSRHRAAW